MLISNLEVYYDTGKFWYGKHQTPHGTGVVREVKCFTFVAGIVPFVFLVNLQNTFLCMVNLPVLKFLATSGCFVGNSAMSVM